MAYGLIYNLNFRSNIAGNRKHRISIYKDGVADAITVNDNNIIGTEEPAVLIWDNTDDIYNNIMASRMEINLYSDDVKQVDIDDILDNTTPSKFKVEFRMEDDFGTMNKYWEGYLANATYEQRISSVPVIYQLVATDLLGTLKNIFTTDGTAVIDSQPTVIKYLDNITGFLPQVFQWRVSNDIQLKPSKFGETNSFTKMHFLQWLFPFKNGFDLYADTADQYIISTLKAINARIFYSNDSWYIINNSSYKDFPTFDLFNSSGVYSVTYSENILKTIPTDYTPILNDLSIRYDTPIDNVEVIANRNQYTTDFDNIGLSQGEIANLSPYPNFEVINNTILFNSTYYSDDFNFIERDPIVKKGNRSIKTQNYISSGSPTQKLLDTGFTGDFQWNAVLSPEFFCSYFMQGSGNEEEDFHLYYSIAREVSSSSTGSPATKQYWNGNNWIVFTLDTSIAVLQDNNQTAPTDQWVEFSEPLPTATPSPSNYARYRVILWQPKINSAPAGQLVVYFDEVFVNRRNVIAFDTAVKTTSKITGSARKNKKYIYEFQHFYPVIFSTTFQSDDITFVDAIGSTQLNRIIAQQILNDNRKHVKRYSVSVYANDFSDYLFPYHKININLTGFQSGDSCIIDRLQYQAKSGIYKIECHETNQDTNVSIDTTVLGGII
jgi:hypothetical protein